MNALRAFSTRALAPRVAASSSRALSMMRSPFLGSPAFKGLNPKQVTAAGFESRRCFAGDGKLPITTAALPVTHKTDKGNYIIRSVKPGDGMAMWQLARSNGLDDNSPYMYALYCLHYGDKCVLAESEATGEPVAYILAHSPPARPETYFVWQVGTSPSTRGTGLTVAMLDAAVTHGGSTHVEASSTPANIASNKFFQKYARHRGCEWDLSEDWIPMEHLTMPSRGGSMMHQREDLYRVGPF